MKKKLEIQGIQWMEMEDPTFEAGVAKTAIATMTNPTGKSFSYTGEIYLDVTKVATSGVKAFTLGPGETVQVTFPVTMPEIEGTFHVYLDIKSGGQPVQLFQATEDVIIVITAAIDVGPIVWE